MRPIPWGLEIVRMPASRIGTPALNDRVWWAGAVILSAAIAISYLDRQTLPWAISAIQRTQSG